MGVSADKATTPLADMPSYLLSSGRCHLDSTDTPLLPLGLADDILTRVFVLIGRFHATRLYNWWHGWGINARRELGKESSQPSSLSYRPAAGIPPAYAKNLIYSSPVDHERFVKNLQPPRFVHPEAPFGSGRSKCSGRRTN